MTKIRIIYRNFWREGAVYDQSSQNPQFPAADISIDSPLIPWRGATGSLNEHVDSTLGQPATSPIYNFVGLINHNISVSADIYHYGAGSADFGTGLVAETLLYNNKNLFKFLGAQRQKEYGRIAISDALNPSNYIQVGNIFVGKYWEPEESFLSGYSEGYDDVSEGEESDSRVFFAQEKTRLRTFNLSFRLNDIDKGEAMLFLKETGLTKTFIICLDSDYPNTYCYLVMNTELNDPVHRAFNNWLWSITCRQVAGS